jgi:hypothetical protein
VRIDERTYAQLPPKLQALFEKVPNPQKAEVLQAFAQFSAPGQIAKAANGTDRRKTQNVYGTMARGSNGAEPRADAGSPSRFFYCAKASKAERNGSKHPTVKPLKLMEWLVQLITPPGGTVLDPFCGTGTTLVAAHRHGFDAVGIDNDPQSCADADEKVQKLGIRPSLTPSLQQDTSP